MRQHIIVGIIWALVSGSGMLLETPAWAQPAKGKTANSSVFPEKYRHLEPLARKLEKWGSSKQQTSTKAFISTQEFVNRVAAQDRRFKAAMNTLAPVAENAVLDSLRGIQSETGDGQFKPVRVVVVDGEQRVIFRQSDDSGVAYYEFIVQDTDVQSPIFCDIYNPIFGGMYSKTISEVLALGADYPDQLPTLKRLGAARTRGDIQGALAEIDNFSDEVQRTCGICFLRLSLIGMLPGDNDDKTDGGI